MILVLSLFFGCSEKQKKIVVERMDTSAIPRNVVITEDLVYQLKVGMTYFDVAMVIGTTTLSNTSVMNPENKIWKMDDGRELHIVFNGDYDKFMEDLDNGLYRLPEEPKETNELGNLQPTENEKNAIMVFFANRIATSIVICDKNGKVIKKIA